MNKIYIIILLIMLISFTVYSLHMISRDRSNAPTWDEIERAFKNRNIKYVGDVNNPQLTNQKSQ